MIKIRDGDLIPEFQDEPVMTTEKREGHVRMDPHLHTETYIRGCMPVCSLKTKKEQKQGESICLNARMLLFYRLPAELP